MFRFNFADSMPVNLIQQPIERAAVLVWLIAFAQFCSSGLIMTAAATTISWFLTAPLLMVSSMTIAIRAHNRLPLAVTFIVGAMAVLHFMNVDWRTVLQWLGSSDIKTDLNSFSLSLSVYALLFWTIGSRFLSSRYFLIMHRLTGSAKESPDLYLKFQTFLFYLSFLTLNACAVISVFYPGQTSVMTMLMAIILLFISGKQLSAQLRGVLLPVYVSIILIIHLFYNPIQNTYVMGVAARTAVFNSDSIALILWSLLLWLGHNFIVGHYNKLFPEIKITTVLWPWFGLLMLLVATFQQLPVAFFEPAFLLILLAYLFLMLRNTSLEIISWSIVLLLSWLVLLVLSPLNPQVFSLRNLSQFGYYGQQALFFSLALLVLSHLWDRCINHYLSHLGWQKISFRKAVLTVSFLVTTFWLVINLVLVTGLISGWFNLIKEGLGIELTTVFVVIAFIALNFFMNNKLLANLIHFSTIILLIVLWGFNKPVPVYTLFAAVHLAWVILPVLLKWLCGRWSLSYPENIITTTGNWIYISFVAAVLSLFSMADRSNVGADSLIFLSSIAILFVASILLIRRYSHKLWIVFSYLLATALILSLRFMLMGNIPVNGFDTMGILLISVLLFTLNRLGLLASPIISSDTLVRLLPLTALFTLSWQAGSVHSSLTLFVLGIFYLLIAKGSRFTLYSGLLFINLAVYLWMPALSDYTNLLLFYITPVSISLLLITHLHRNDIEPQLQNKMRFMALSLLYIVITADIFISETLYVFLLGLLLGLASVIYGISSKTRAFLYTGFSFIVINILGQLIVLYPDGRLGRALILMGTGAVITGVMIWFNIKREMLLSTIRVFRADLDSWD